MEAPAALRAATEPLATSRVARRPAAAPAATQFSRFYEIVLEAGWLAALVLAPLFFNPNSTVVFEPDKIGLLRTIALVMALAWLLKFAEDNRDVRLRGLLRLPFAAPVIGFLAVGVIASLFSIVPAASWLGSYIRAQGTYSMLAYALIFAAVAVNVRRRDQLERILTTTIVTSLPVSMYALMQAYQIDPLPWSVDVANRVAGPLGNPVFLAAYLIMVLPITGLRLWQAAQKLRDGAPSSLAIARTAVYVVIGFIQLLALIDSQSRGPAFGLLLGMLLFACLMGAKGYPRITLSALGLAAVAGGLVLLLNLSLQPLEPIRSTPRLARLSHILDAQDDSAKLRTLIWTGILDTLRPHQPLVGANDQADVFNPLRPLIGYGPETIYQAFGPFIPSQLATANGAANWDRTHNETLAVATTTGLLGLIAYFGLFWTIFYLGLRWLGCLPDKHRALYACLTAAGGLVGTLALVAWKGAPYVGIGLPLGLVGGVALYLALRVVTRQQASSLDANQMVLICLLAAVGAHFIETQFGFPVTATWIQLWVYLGLIVATGWRFARPHPGSLSYATPAARGQSPSSLPGLTHELVWPVLVTTLCMVALGYVFFDSDKGWAGLLLLVLPVWLLAPVLLCDDARQAMVVRAAALVLSMAFKLFYSALATQALQSDGESILDITRRVIWEGHLYAAFLLWVLLMMASAGVALALGQGARSGRQTRIGWEGSLAAFAVVLGVGYFSNVRPVVADVVAKEVQPAIQDSDWATAAAVEQAAVNLAPHQSQYRTDLGNMLLSESVTVAPDQGQKLLQQALGELTVAQQLDPLDPLNTENLAKLWQQWVASYPDDNQADERASNAETNFARAVTMSPNGQDLRKDWGTFEQDMAAANFDDEDYPSGLARLERWQIVDARSATPDALQSVLKEHVADPAMADIREEALQQSFDDAVSDYADSLDTADYRADPVRTSAAKAVLQVAQTTLAAWRDDSSSD